MNWFSQLSIRAKLTIIVMTTTCVALLVAVAAMIVFDELAARTRMREDAIAAAKIVASNSAKALAFRNRRAVDEILGVLRANPHIQAAAVYDDDGRLFGRFIRPGAEVNLVEFLPEGAPPPQTDWLEVLYPIEGDGVRIGAVILKMDLNELRERRARGLLVSLGVLAMAAGVGYLLANRLQSFITKPLLQLSETSHAVAVEKNYSIRVPKQAHDEIGRLVDGFNEMLAQVELRDRALNEAHAELERRVGERTRELFEANRNLHEEVDAHKKAREESDALRDRLQAAYENLKQEAAERTQIQAALRRSEERFSKAFRANPVALAILTRRGGTFVDVNDRFAELVGGARDAVIGTQLVETPIWAVEETRARIQQFLADGQPLRNWQCQLGGNGTRKRVALVSAEPFVLGDEPCVLLMTEDISERADLENQLRQAQKMDAIGQLAAGVAHDFNNLLTVIQGYSQLLLAMQPADGMGREALEKIINAIQRAAQLTGQLLTFSRKQVAQPKSLDLNRVVANVAAMLRPLLGENVRLNLRTAESLPAVMADSAMLEQVLVNLAVNARDAMPRGGELGITTFLCEIDAAYLQFRPQANVGKFVCLQVGDNGCGMDTTTMQRIFEPFFTTKGVGKGTGLGLATVYGIIKQHKGWVEVVSQVGIGTTFKVFIPAVESAPSNTEIITNPDAVKGGAEKILVVEDEPALRELVTKVLRNYGYDVLEASHGKEALRVWQALPTKPDLLLTDMMMPEGMTGWELAEQIRTDTPELKVVFTSGYSPEIFGGEVQLDQRANFLPKPFHPRVLAKTVRTCLDT